MKGLVKLGVIAVVLYFVVSEGKPWLEQLFGGAGLGPMGGGGSPTLRCIEVTEDAADHFADTLLRWGKPPINEDRWSSAYAMSEGRAHQAEEACDCVGLETDAEREACDQGRDALSDLESFMSRYDDGIRNGNPPLNIARRQDAIYEKLNSARRRLR